MRIDDALTGPEPCFSFEFFPPKTPEGEKTLDETLLELAKLDPCFVSVTYGAGGSTREGTAEITARIKRDLGIEAMAHLSCVGETVEGLGAMLDRFAADGIENVLALRGDPPRGAVDFVAPEGGLTCATDLAALISERGGFTIGGSCFPEIHPEAASPEADIAYLKTKVEAGATFLITQLFFDNAVYFEWLDQVREAGINVPIVPGIVPITSYAGIRRFCDLCGANIPERLAAAMEPLGGDQQAEAELGIAYATRQCEELLAAGAPGIHFYVLNKAPATRAVLGALKIARPWERATAPLAAK